MKTTIKLFSMLLVLGVIFSLFSCTGSGSCGGKNPHRNLPIELRQLVKTTDTKSESHSSFFLIMGSYNESTTQEITIKVFANIDGAYRFISMPIEKVRINIDNSLIKPNMQLEYSFRSTLDDKTVLDWFADERTNANLIHNPKLTYIINCPEQYLPEKLLPIEL